MGTSFIFWPNLYDDPVPMRLSLPFRLATGRYFLTVAASWAVVGMIAAVFGPSAIRSASAQQPSDTQPWNAPQTNPAALQDMSKYFGGDDEDSLAERLRQADAPQVDEDRDRPQHVGDLEPDEVSRNPQSSTRSTDALLSQQRESFSLDDDEDEATEDRNNLLARERALIGHLHRLRKPLHEIKMVDPVSQNGALGHNSSDPIKPVNVAAHLNQLVPARLVTSEPISPRVSNRYPISFCHRRLYFEEIDLERCGQNHGCLQNVSSAGWFLFGVVATPYRLATQPPNELVRSRGDCRSGQSYDLTIEPFAENGKDSKGLLLQAASLAGFRFLLE